MKKHSQQLNIKTTQLASWTAVFHSKKQRPAAEVSHLSAMDVDKPEPDAQVGGLEAIPEGPTLQFDGGETDDDDDSDNGDGDGTGEGLLVDSDSEDEFESDDDENIGGHGGQAENGRRLLDFELRAAEAGSVLHRRWHLDEKLIKPLNPQHIPP